MISKIVDALVYLADRFNLFWLDRVADRIVDFQCKRGKCIDCLWRKALTNYISCAKCRDEYEERRQLSINSTNSKYNIDMNDA